MRAPPSPAPRCQFDTRPPYMQGPSTTSSRTAQSVISMTQERSSSQQEGTPPRVRFPHCKPHTHTHTKPIPLKAPCTYYQIIILLVLLFFLADPPNHPSIHTHAHPCPTSTGFVAAANECKFCGTDGGVLNPACNPPDGEVHGKRVRGGVAPVQAYHDVCHTTYIQS